MQFSTGVEGREQAIIDLFAATFAASEGAEEGARIGGLVRDLLSGVEPEDIRVFTAVEHGAPVAGAVFTRLAYANDPRRVFILAPMAVTTGRQGQGIGQALLHHALTALREAGVDVAITYGDPAFYGKLGFMPITEALAPAPLPLSHAEGWAGQSLTGAALTPLRGPCTCVAALHDPAFW